MPLKRGRILEFSDIIKRNFKFPQMKKNYLLMAILFTKNKPVFFKDKIKKIGFLNILLLLLAIFLNTTAYAQNLVPFKIRYATELKGDMLVTGNNILGININPLNDNTTNQSVSMQYIDIDNDPLTFNSSSADLTVPSSVECFKIAYAGLYWGALIKTGDSRTDIDKVKFKTPGSSTYTDLTGTIIYDEPSNPIVPDDNKPYSCYYDVTSIISGLTSPQGTYTVANVQSSIGSNGTTGLAAGWTLYVIYEDPKTTTKYMVSYDGFSALYDDSTLNIDVSGFITPPSPAAINLKFGFAALNGDKSPNNSNKTKVEISNGTANGTALTTNLRPSNYFFNSSITNLDNYITTRNPNGTNSLGYDTGIEQLLNVNKSTVGNNATNVRFTLQVARGQANPIFSFFNAFQVNVIAPDIALTKLVKDISGNDIGNTDVVLGTNLYYEIGFQNTGNDNVTNFTLKDVLPNNVIFNYPSDIISLPTGVTHTYNATTRELVFSIPNDLVKVGDVSQTIRLHVQVVSNYRDLLDACSNEIKNQAFASYRGVINTTPRVDEGSFASTVCNFGTPSSTNFLVNIDGLTFSGNEVLCGASVQLSGPNGYDSYSWSTSPTGTPVIGTNQTYNATDTGTYYITSTSACATVTEAITVNPFGNTITNPVIPYADEVVTCPNNGKDLPNIFLCGANATRLIQTNISDASTIVWEKLDESSCAAITVENCANENTLCQWNQVGTGPDYTATTSGQFRMTINYPGGCYSIFYFNVYQNLLNPTATTRDIICTKNGEITIGGVPSGYEYSLDGSTYQPSNVFSISTAGAYTVYIRQVGVSTNPCIFSVVNVLIRQRNFTTSTIVTQPLCYGDKGAIKIAAEDAYPQYYYSIYQGATLVNSVGPISASDYEFAGLNPGTYTVRVWTEDGCDYSTNIDIIQPPILSATSALTKPLTCTDGEITVYPTGGTPPYAYYVNGSTSSQTFPQIVVTEPLPAGGLYSIIVVDSQNCSTTTSITVAATPPPVYTISQTDVLCFNDNTGAINFNVTNSNGYTLAYSIDNGVTYGANPTFSNLSAGTYDAIVRYSLAGTDCFTTAEVITITQPTALTAIAGVTELAGCTPSGEGKISITNPQGGIAPYEYSFDNQSTWSTVDDAYKAPGTYTLYIRDANGCIYPMPNVTIDPLPVEPTIEVEDPVFNCDGSASSDVTVTTVPNANYNYEYLIDGVPNTNVPANVFVDLPSGNHVISVKYISATSAISCIPQSDFYFVVATGNVFTASISGVNNVSCSGANDGEITIAAANFDPTNGFQYSIDNGINWVTQMTSPYTITGLAPATYSLRIRYDAASGATCEQSFTQVITAPAPLVTTASVTSPVTCVVGATISASSTGGTPAYRYELWDATATTNIIPSQSSNTFTNVSVGTYIVRSYDANNCTDDTTIITVVAPPTLSATLDPSSDICFDSVNQATLIVTASGGTSPYVYSIDGAPAQNSNTFSIVGSGTHTIVVTDSYGCTSTINNIFIAPQLTAAISNIKELDCTVSPNAVITGTISGGNAPFVVTVISGAGPGTIAQPTATTFTYTTAVADTYQFQIQDAKGCMTTVTATINPLVPVTATLNPVNPSCNGSSDGSVQIIPSGGVGPYTYSFNGSPFTTTSLYTGLSAGIVYSYEVRDSKNCSFTGTVTLTEPTAVITSATVTPFSCSASNTKQSATITIAVPTTGTAPYTYSFNGGGYSASNTLSINDNGTDQLITYSVRDANGCIYTNSVTVLGLNPPTDLNFTAAPITCTATTTTVNASATNGVGTLTYEIISPLSAVTSNTSGTFAGLFPGTYLFKVTDVNGCYYTESLVIAPVTPIAVVGNITSDVLCFGDSSGSGLFTVSGNETVGAYSFALTAGTIGTGTLIQSGNTITLSNVPTGTYTVEVTDTATGCTDDATIVIAQPSAPLALALASNSNANCNVTTSKVTVTATGGTPNYTYSFVQNNAPAGIYTASNTSNLDPLTSLNWDVYVKDANGCIVKLDVVIATDPSPTVTASVPDQCSSNGSSYTISAAGSGGIGTLTYSIGSGFQSTGTFTVTTPGTYTVTVKDANGCTGITTVTVYPVLTSTAILTKDLSCSVPTDATITINAAGGNGAYNYRVSTDSGVTYSTSGFVGNVFTTATPGTYQFEITDANGCTKVSNTIIINPIVYPEITNVTQTQDIFCNGETTATVKVNIDPTKGIAPFTYSIDGINFQSSSTFTGLGAGTYTVTLMDSKGCKDMDNTLTIDQPTAIDVAYHVVDISCVGGISKGSIIIDEVTGGNPSYNYFVTGVNGYNDSELNADGSTSYKFDIVDFGLYQINVVDANGCSVLIQNVKVASPPDDLDIQINGTADCISGGTAEITVAGSLIGVGPFYFNVYKGFGQTYSALDPTWIPEDGLGTKHAIISNLIPGVTYTFIVYDSSSGCYYYEIADTAIPTNSELIASNLVPKNITCKGEADGKVSFDISSIYFNPTNVSYEIYNSLSLATTGISGSGIVPANGTLSVTDLGDLPFGNYIVVIKEEVGADNEGCSIVTDSFNITESAFDLEITASVIQNANCDNDGIVSAQAKNGTAPYQFMISTSATTPLATDLGWVSSSTFNVPVGDYYVYVKDTYGCIQSSTMQTVPLDPSPEIALAVTDNCVNEGAFEITVSEITAGIAPYSISVNGSAFQNISGLPYTLSNLNSGTYTITLKDLNGCTDTKVLTLYRKLSTNAILTKELDCTSSPSPDAIITLNVADGFGPFIYEVSTDGGTTYSASTPFVGPSTSYTATVAGTYTFKVTDANGCEFISTATVDSKITPDFTFVQTNETCIDSNDGTITITPTAGVGPFTYSKDNGATFQASNVFTGLDTTGTYNIVVQDSKLCNSLPQSVTISEPTAVSGTGVLTQELTCGAGNATQAAIVTISGSGGTGSYKYSFNGGASYTTSNTFTTYTAGTVSALVKDSNGCISATAIDVDVPALNPPTDLDFVATAVTCLALTSDVTLTTTNGVGPLSYEIVFPASATSNTSGASNGIFTGLNPGTYLFQVTDANGCTYQEAYTIDLVTNITVSGQLISDVSCNPGSNGEVQFYVANFAGTYSYTLDGGTTVISGQTTPTITLPGLAMGTYTIIVTDEITGCTATTYIDVSQPAPLALVANPFINANCNFGAQVSVTTTGGVSPYSYSYVKSGDPAGTYAASASAVLDPTISTTWDVWVKDANGCVIASPLPITIETDPLPIVTVNPYSPCPSATGEYTFTLSATGMAPFQYSIGAGFQTSPTFIVNAPGTYDVTVRDSNGCTTTEIGLITILPALQLESDITALPSCLDGDGTLTLSATGGSGSYEYSLDSGAYQPSANFTNLSAGPHTATVRDITTNCTFSILVTLEAATPVTGFGLSKTDVTCNGGNDGVLTATMATPAPGVNDNPIYMYSLSGDAVRPAQTSNIFSGLIAGNYTVDVISARGCVATENISIIEPAIIAIPAPAVAQFGCNAGSNATQFATITVSGVTGGSGVYTYEFIKGGTVVQFGANNVYTEADLLGGSYTVNVYDDKGCMGTAPATITIVPFIALDTISVNVNNAITCVNPEDITVSVSSIGGTPTNLQYTVVDYNATTGVSGVLYPSQTNATGVFTGLPAADYQITVENMDTGCSITRVHYVNEPNTFDLNINNIVDVTCFGGSNGSADVTFIDRVITATNPDQSGSFSYTIVDSFGNSITSGISATAGPTTINNLAAGIYTITATLINSPFCTVSKNFTITQPAAALAIAETHTEITCISGNNDGSISATATGGWPGGYQFELVGPVNVAYSSQSNFSNLTTGLYTVNVRDSKGCIATTNVMLTIPPPISVTASSDTAMVSCFGDKSATITVNMPTGGQGSNYMYTLNTTSLVPATASGPQASPVFSGLGAGTYSVTVTDGYNCSATTASIVITAPTEVNTSLVVATTQTCLNETTLTLSATGGTGSYTYSSNAAFTTVLGSFASSVTFPVPVGTYVYYVKDANGCISDVSNQIKIDPLPPLTINIDQTNAVINCAGDNTGVIVATAQGGLGNYSYTLLDGAGATVQGPSASGNFTGLFAGNYQVRVDSGDCTTTSSMITITQPLTPLTATYAINEVTCNGANNGILTITASGGTGIIKYAISPNSNQFFDTNIFDNLAPGNYDVIVQDVLGCYVTYNFDITEPAPIRATTIVGTIIPEICFGDMDGAFSIDVTGGVLPYSVILDDPSGTYTTGAPTQTQFDFDSLTGGMHTVYIQDANGCSYEWEVVLPESIFIDPIATVDYSCVNNAASNSVTVSVDSSITDPTDLDYSLDGAAYQASNVFTNVAPGMDHYIDVRHTNGCIQRTTEFDILQVDPLALALSDGGLNEIVATATGGGGGYQYTFNGESTGTKNTYIIYKSGDYTVEVTDSNGCVATATRYFEYIDVCIPNHFTPNGDGIEDGWAPGCTINYKDLTFDIFDRYGRKIATYRLGQQWDGKYNGEELPSGDYWFVVKLNDLKDNREFVGHFTLYR